MTAEKGSGRVGDSRPAGVKPEAEKHLRSLGERFRSECFIGVLSEVVGHHGIDGLAVLAGVNFNTRLTRLAPPPAHSVRYHRDMSNDHDAHDVSGVNPLAERVKANVIQMATVVRQLWEGYLQSPHGC